MTKKIYSTITGTGNYIPERRIKNSDFLNHVFPAIETSPFDPTRVRVALGSTAVGVSGRETGVREQGGTAGAGGEPKAVRKNPDLAHSIEFIGFNFYLKK